MMPADPKANFLAHEAEIREAIERVLQSGLYILGPEVGSFEQEFSKYLGSGNTLSVANGTEALELALRALGAGPGKFVATVANTVSATVAAIEQTGATPLFVDIDDETMLMSASSLEASLLSAPGPVSAVIPVHLYGCVADMPALQEIAARHGAAVLEDCAQSHGATLHGRKAGTFGELAAFSFYPTKNLGALGDGGAVHAGTPALADKLRLLRHYGWRERYVSEIPGRNSRLDELQAAILRVKLRHLDAENDRRRSLAAVYLENLRHPEVRLPVVPSGCLPVWHQFTIRSPRREALRLHLAKSGIHAAPLYPLPQHKQPAYATPQSLPHSEQACAQVLCLPCHPQLARQDVERVIEAIHGWV
jgi:dTDP-4-amino-4,6-dideoxygalactose transaminase